MKLGSLREGGRDGTLVVVDKKLERAVKVPEIARTLQAALDAWAETAPRLAEVYAGIADNPAAFDLDCAKLASPLPRAYQWVDGSAYVNHVELVRKARGVELPPEFWDDPLMYQGGSDAFLAPRDPIPAGDPAWELDIEGEVAVILGDVPRGATPETAGAAIRLVMLANDVSLRGLAPAEVAKGFGFVQAKPPTAFSPVAVTPAALGDMWRDAKLHGALRVDLDGAPLGRAESGEDMAFDFARLAAHAARTRPLRAGTILGSGTVSNRDADGGPGRPVAEGGRGYSCVAEQRMVETLEHGAPRTPYLAPGAEARIEMRDAAGHSVFGAIEQRVVEG